MPAELVWRPQALEDLMDIYVKIGLDNEAAAERGYSAIEARAGVLVDFPRMGSRGPEIAAMARMLVEGACLVLYELHPDSARRAGGAHRDRPGGRRPSGVESPLLIAARCASDPRL